MTRIRNVVLGSALAALSAGAQAGAHGKTVYEGTCIACHSVNGKGALPGVPDLTSAKGPLKGSDEQVVRRMRDGFQSPGSPMAMPPKGGNPALTDDDLKAVLAYMRKAFGR